MMTPTIAATPIPASIEPTMINTTSQGSKQITDAGGASGALVGGTPSGVDVVGAFTGVIVTGVASIGAATGVMPLPVHCCAVQPDC